MIHLIRFYVCGVFFFLAFVQAATLPELSAQGTSPFLRYQQGLPQKDSKLPALRDTRVKHKKRMKRLQKRYQGVLDCAVEMIEEGYQGMESIESGFFVLAQLPKSGEDLKRLERSCFQRLKEMKKADRVSAHDFELGRFYNDLPVDMQKIWERVFQVEDHVVRHPMMSLQQTYEGRYGGFVGVGIGVQLGVRVKKKESPLGRRFLYTRPLFPVSSSYGAGLVFGGVSARRGEHHVEIAQDSPPGSRILPGVAIHEGSVDRGGEIRQERFAYSPAIGLGLWENLSSPFEDGLRMTLKPDYSFLLKALSL